MKKRHHQLYDVIAVIIASSLFWPRSAFSHTYCQPCARMLLKAIFLFTLLPLATNMFSPLFIHYSFMIIQYCIAFFWHLPPY